MATEDNPVKWFPAKRYAINIILLLIGVGVVIFYTLCGDTCTYLQGGIFGIELQYLGIIYVGILILFNILRKDLMILMLLSAGIGVELFLVGYQILHNTYCPYCLIFAAIIFIQFLLNMDGSKKLLVIVCVVLGFFSFFIFFQGSAFPVYSETTTLTVLPFITFGTT